LSGRPGILLTALPNLISLLRLCLVPLAIWLMLSGRYQSAFWVFILAGVTDAIDGFIAKHFDVRTTLGGYLDPLADKALLMSVYVTLGYRDHIENWLVILIVFRDVLIIGGAILYQTLTQSLTMQPLWISKINTVAQIMLAALLLGLLGFKIEGYGAIVQALTWFVAASTVASGAAYLIIWGSRFFSIEGRK
jgi:cardiolipin synthase (CMP-forming)